MDNSSDFLCPICKKGLLVYRDHCKRIVRQVGGETEWIWIPRYQCNHAGCRRIHRMLPDFLVPFKHYQEEVVVDTLDGRLDPEEVDDRPSTQTVKHWKEWIRTNSTNIDGNLRSIAYRELGFSGELLRSGIPLLLELRRSLPEGWLRAILRILYNSGARLRPCYG